MGYRREFGIDATVRLDPSMRGIESMFPKTYFPNDFFPNSFFTDGNTPPLYQDDFDRGRPSLAWSVQGGAWTQAGGIAAQVSTSVGDPKKLLLSDPNYQTDVELLTCLRVDRWSIGDMARTGLSVRTDPTTGYGYNLVLREYSGNRYVQFLDDYVTWGNVFPFPWQVGSWYWMRLRAQGSTLSGKLWADGTSEPSSWPFVQVGWTKRTTGLSGLHGGSAGQGFANTSFRQFQATSLNSATAVFNDAFTIGQPSADWVTRGGTWTESGSVVSQVSTADGDPKKLVLIDKSYPSDGEVLARIRVDSWVSGGYARAGIGLRTDPTTGLGYNLVFHKEQQVRFLNDFVAFGNSYPFAWQLGSWYWFRLRAQGSTLLGKVWADGSPEPTGWPYTQTGWTNRTSGAPSINGGSSGSGNYSTMSCDRFLVRS